MTNTNEIETVSLNDAKTMGAAWLAANPAAVEVEFAVRCGSVVISVWVQRNGDAFDRPQHG